MPPSESSPPSSAPQLQELAERLGRSLLFTTALLQRLEAGLKQRRVQWISAKAGELAEAPQSLEPLAQEIAAAEQGQQQLLEQIAGLLPGTPLRADAPLQTNVTRIAGALPKASAVRLRQQAASASRAARAVRVEVGLGDRLLRFSRAAHEALVQKLVRRTHPVAGQTHGYDRRARAVAGNLVGGADPTGSLIDGRL